ncbi:MAG TPA: PIG-L family deacetylase [Acidobacteriaceae bacterium]|nr:PIG-L family deacetylase [Acidobacteriaceae bacterium]
MKCSVVVPTYNRASLLSLTLLSLVAQDLPVSEFEVLVVDDGSSDNTREIVESFADRLNIRYFHTPDEGYRVARARNIGIRAALGSICVLVDSGILLASYCLRAHCTAHESSAEPLAVCGYVRGFNEDNEDAEDIRQHIDPRQVDRTLARLQQEGLYPDLREEFYAKYGDDFHQLPAPWLVFWTCNVSAKTEVFRRAGLFDEQFTTWGGEDVELAYRMHRQGCRFVVARDAASIHYPHEKSYERNMRDARSSYLYFAAKHATPITSLVVDNHFWVINDIIREKNLPRCEDFLRSQQPLAARGAEPPEAREPNAPRRTIFVFAPHPDDETIAAGGAICRHREDGDEVFIVFSTDGSESHTAVLGIHTDPCPEELAAVRQSEAVAASETLGVPADHVVLLHFADTQLALQYEALTDAVRALLLAHQNVDAIYLPDPDRELNADHRITGLAVLAAVRELQLTPRLLKYVVWDKDVEREFQFQNRLDAPVRIDDHELTEVVDITRFHGTKLNAMAKHRTQVEFFCKAQTRPVVPVWLMEKLSRQTFEQFRIHPLT